MSDWWIISVLLGLALSASAAFIYPLKIKKLSAGFGFLILFVLIIAGYLCWGSLAQWQEYQHKQELRQQTQALLKKVKSPNDLINKLRAKLDETPKSAKGWYLLGRLYSAQDNKQQALDSFAKAHQLEPQNEQYTVNYAHALWEQNNRQFNSPIIKLFESLLADNPNQPDALAMLAMKAYMSHDYSQAINYWQKLLKLVPPQSSEAKAIRKAIAKAEEQIKG